MESAAEIRRIGIARAQRHFRERQLVVASSRIARLKRSPRTISR
jgi:hypothetical protein